MDLAWTHTEK